MFNGGRIIAALWFQLVAIITFMIIIMVIINFLIMIIIMVTSIIVIISLSILILLIIISTAIIQIRSKERARCFACEQNSRLLLGTKCEMRQISVWTALRELEMAKPRIRDWDSVDWERWECEKESKSIKSRQQNHKQNIGTERGEWCKKCYQWSARRIFSFVLRYFKYVTITFALKGK